MIKRQVIGLACSLMFLASLIPNPVQAAEDKKDDLATFSQTIKKDQNLDINAAYAIDEETGQVLIDLDGHTKYGIASLTKLLSLFIVYDQIAAGRMSMDTKIPISPALSALSVGADLSNVPLEERDDFYTVSQLIDMVIVGSANAATTALASYIAGSEPAFIENYMKPKLAELGIDDYAIYTASGLSGDHLITEDGSVSPFENEDENALSARDLTYLTRELIHRYPDVLARSQQVYVDFQMNEEQSFPVGNSNLFLPGLRYERPDVYGIKTGTEDFSGSSIVIQSEIGGRKIILTCLGAKDNDQRFIQTANILDSLQNKLAWQTLQIEGELVVPESDVRVHDGRIKTVDLEYKNNAGAFFPKNYNPSQSNQLRFSQTWQYDINGNIVVNAPLDQEEPVNTSLLSNDFYQNIEDQPGIINYLVPAENVPRVSFVVQIARLMSEMFGSWQDWLRSFLQEHQIIGR